jgi:OmpA-OmpF porin, OOP family
MRIRKMVRVSTKTVANSMPLLIMMVGLARIKCSSIVLVLVGLLLLAGFSPLRAQSIGYAEAIDGVATACGNDIAKLCRQAPLGGGRVLQCLNQNQAGVGATCKSSLGAMQALLTKRIAAQAAVLRVCDVDIKRLCSGVQIGDGNLMECFYKTLNNISPQCRQTVADAGFEASLAPSASRAPIKLTSYQLVDSLEKVGPTAQAISAARLREMVSAAVNDPSRAERVNRAPLTDQLERLAQFTIAVQFDLNSARIRPDSFRAVGLMADALNHPALYGYHFLIIGHTDGRGDRRSNLDLSQRRADSIRDALINPFGIDPARIAAIGFGEEQFLNRRNPEAAENRRVQLVNIGK